MKNLIILFILLFFITNLSAQIQKGTVLLGGTVGFNNSNSEGYGITVFNVSPTAGFFINNRLALGAALGLILTTDGDYTSTTTGFTPFARYYFNPTTTGSARFFGQILVGFQNSETDESLFEGNSRGFGLGLGADFF